MQLVAKICKQNLCFWVEYHEFDSYLCLLMINDEYLDKGKRKFLINWKRVKIAWGPLPKEVCNISSQNVLF